MLLAHAFLCRRMMTELFSPVEMELLSLVSFGEQLDPLNSLNMLVVIGQRVAHAQHVRISTEVEL